MTKTNEPNLEDELRSHQPIVIEAKEKKKKKKKYSNGFSRAFQELESGLTKSSRKVAKAVREALDEYEQRREESVAEKKDGALKDLLRNQSKALRKGLPIAAEAPADFLDAIAESKAVRRILGN
jgi:hypothetical protein